MTQVPAIADPPLPDGVHLGLSDIDYFGQDCMGSSDWNKLHSAGIGWWWGSRHNPNRKADKTTAEQAYGTALHAILLEGIPAYEARFIVQPDPDDYVDLVTMADQIKAKLKKEGFDITGKSAWNKEQWCDAMAANLPDVPCWDTIYANFEARIAKRKTVTSLDDRMLRFMHKVATDPTRADNEDVRQIFAQDGTDHPPLAEVSIFATINGVRRRWRIDRMLPTVDVDLKSLGSWRGRPLPYETGEVLARRGWDLQRADYHIGRTTAYEHIRAGRIFGGTIEQRRYLQTFPDAYPIWDWCWLVFQKPDPKGQAPILFPIWDDSFLPRDPYHPDEPPKPSWLRGIGERKLQAAIRLYKTAKAEFGLDTPWARVEPLHFSDENRSPRIFLPHWIGDDTPTEAEAYEQEYTE